VLSAGDAWSPAASRSASSSTCATALRAAPALELSFFDHQQTGQLMSRATVDLQAVRFFLGYGLIFIASRS
jgi:ABC-type multidrug transport system fused ATPase/permease subunit